MYVRCAFFEGVVQPTNQRIFDQCILEQVLPQMAKFPRCREVRALWGREFEDGAQDTYLILEHYYDTLEDIHKAIHSENREEVWLHLNKILPFFDGRICHVNAEVRVVPGQRK